MRFLLRRLVPVILSLLLSSPAGAIDPDPVRVRVSVKRVQNAAGALPTGTYGSEAEITRVIGKSNDALRKSGANWILQLEEIVDTRAASAFYRFSSGSMGQFESDAKQDKAGFAWRDNAINIYVVDEITDAGGVCSFPAFGASRELITINSRGILGGSEGWLHEMGHYFNLIHTHEGDQVLDTIADPPLPDPYTCQAHDENFLAEAAAAGASTEDTFNGLHNVMGYHCDPQVLTPLQVIRMRRALKDFRARVLVPAAADQAPRAQIELPPGMSGGTVAFAGSPVTITLDGGASSDGDGGGVDNLTCRWSLVSGPAGGAQLEGPTAGWLRGATGIGYSDDDDLTQLTDMENNYLTVFATRTFEIDDPARFSELSLDISYDDGFAAYLNGREVARRNLAAGAGRNTPATVSQEAREVIDLGAFLEELVPGTNRLSIEVHNSALDSSDLSLHPILKGKRTTGTATTLIASRAIWFYQKGSAGPPDVDWKLPEFDAPRSRIDVTFTQPGEYRVRLTVDDGFAPGNTNAAEVTLSVGGTAFVRGDCNGDGTVDLTDALRNLLELFGGADPVKCPDACDADDDEQRNLTDSVIILGYLFNGGRPPASPFPGSGLDPSGEALGCKP